MKTWSNLAGCQSSVQGISLQTTLRGGIGRYLKNTNRARVTVLGGVAWQSTDYEPSTVAVASQEGGAGLIVTDLTFFVFKKTNFSLRAYLVPFTETGRVRFNTNASYYLKLLKDFSWNFSFYGNWDNPATRKVLGQRLRLQLGVGSFGDR